MIPPTQPPLAADGIIENADGTISFVRVVPLTTAEGYGVDLKCIDDLDPALASTDPNSIETLAQDSYHRISTRRETLPDDADYGIDIVEFMHAGKTDADLRACEGQIITELQKDDRIKDVSASVTFDATTNTLHVQVRITPEDSSLRTFSLIIVVTDGLALLEAIEA